MDHKDTVQMNFGQDIRFSKNLIQRNETFGSAKVQTPLAVCRRLAMVHIFVRELLL